MRYKEKGTLLSEGALFIFCLGVQAPGALPHLSDNLCL
jgi:hypothetical protein